MEVLPNFAQWGFRRQVPSLLVMVSISLTIEPKVYLSYSILAPGDRHLSIAFPTLLIYVTLSSPALAYSASPSWIALVL